MFPEMIELFSRKPDGFSLPEDAHLTPIPVDQELESLSAILLDEGYYEFIRQGKRMVEGLAILKPSTSLC